MHRADGLHEVNATCTEARAPDRIWFGDASMECTDQHTSGVLVEHDTGRVTNCVDRRNGD